MRQSHSKDVVENERALLFEARTREEGRARRRILRQLCEGAPDRSAGALAAGLGSHLIGKRELGEKVTIDGEQIRIRREDLLLNRLRVRSESLDACRDFFFARGTCEQP